MEPHEPVLSEDDVRERWESARAAGYPAEVVGELVEQVTRYARCAVAEAALSDLIPQLSTPRLNELVKEFVMGPRPANLPWQKDLTATPVDPALRGRLAELGYKVTDSADGWVIELPSGEKQARAYRQWGAEHPSPDLPGRGEALSRLALEIVCRQRVRL
jgi:hypothetical protein